MEWSTFETHLVSGPPPTLSGDPPSRLHRPGLRTGVPLDKLLHKEDGCVLGLRVLGALGLVRPLLRVDETVSSPRSCVEVVQGSVVRLAPTRLGTLGTVETNVRL